MKFFVRIMTVSLVCLSAFGKTDNSTQFCKRFFDDLTKEMEIKPDANFGTFDRPDPNINKTVHRDGSGNIKSTTFNNETVTIHFSGASSNPEIKNTVDLSYRNTDSTPKFYSDLFQNKIPQHLIFYLNENCQVSEITYHFNPYLEQPQFTLDPKTCGSSPAHNSGIKKSSLKSVCNLFGLNSKAVTNKKTTKTKHHGSSDTLGVSK